MTVNLLNGEVIGVVAQVPRSGESYGCTTNCKGVTVSGPDVDGNYTVSFSNTVLHRDEAFPLPSDRTIALTSGDILFPPLPF